MIFRADFTDVIEGHTIIELDKLEWVQKLQSANRLDVLFAYPMLDPPQIGERCKVLKDSGLVFEGYVSSMDDCNLTLTAGHKVTLT